jgi:hypothetical protein
MSEEKEMMSLPADEVRALIAMASEFNTLKATVQNLTEGRSDSELDAKKPRGSREHNVTILFVDKKPVIGLANVGDESNPVRLYEVADKVDPSKRLLVADILVKDMTTGAVETLKAVKFADFIDQAERRDCRVIKMIGEEWVIEQGVTMKRELQGDKYSMSELGYEVPMEVSGADYEFVVDIGGNTPLTIHQDWVNMAKTQPRSEKQVIKRTDNVTLNVNPN